MIADARIQRVHRAMLFIEPRLFSELRAPDVANAVGGSVHQLQRQFTQVYGISLAAYIRTRRLSEAARMLRLGHESLAVALRCQYGSQAAFTRAFRKQFGLPPTQFRKSNWATITEIKMPTIPELIHRDNLEKTPALSWLHDDLPLLGLTDTLDFNDLAGFQETQEKLARRVGDHHEAVGMAVDVASANRMSFFLGVDAQSVDEDDGLTNSKLRRGLYAVFRHRGPAETVRHSISYFAQTWDAGPAALVGEKPAAETFSLADRWAPNLTVCLWLAVEACGETSVQDA